MATIHLPQHLQIMAEQRAAAGGYQSVDSYIASLIESDEQAPISGELEAQILRGLDSGSAVEITPALLREVTHRARAGRGTET